MKNNIKIPGIMIDYLKSIISKENLPMLILMAAGWWSLNQKMNDMLIVDSVNVEKIEVLEKGYDNFRLRINSLEVSMAAHFGDAYIRDEEN